jgi:uncharacterized protein HemX
VENQTSPTHAAPAKKPAKKLKNLLKGNFLLILVLIVAVAAAAFFYAKYQNSQDKLNHPDTLAKAQTSNLVEKVGKHVELPTDEQPTVATVSDVSKLSNQTFFASAKNGDKVLIYSKAKTAVLYRPGEDKVINIAPLNLNSTPNQ